VTAKGKNWSKVHMFWTVCQTHDSAIELSQHDGRDPGVPSQSRPHRLLPFAGFVSTASAAESLRSRWGWLRGAPECSSQAFPIAAPQVVQGTDNICSGVSSLVFTIFIMQHSTARKCSILLIFNTLAKRKAAMGVPEFLGNCVQK
jgi:hypothetical protein